MKIVITVSAIALMLSGCATIIKGSSQEITVNTNPTAASCALNREGTKIGEVNPTPGMAKVDKTKNDITVICDKDGYQQATYMAHSDIEGATFGNIALGGLIGWGVDSATGSDNHYQSPINITLVPRTAQTPAPMVSGVSAGAVSSMR
jgi:uncharacterized protein YceK